MILHTQDAWDSYIQAPTLDPSTTNNLWSMNQMDMSTAMSDASPVEGVQQQASVGAQQQQQSGSSAQQDNLFSGSGSAFLGVGAMNGNGMM